MIRVKATDDGDYLMISSISGNHNHALNKVCSCKFEF